MLKARVLTALVMLVVLYLATTMLSPFAFGLVLAVVMLPALLEWTSLMGLYSRRQKLGYLLVFYGALAVLAVWAGFSPAAQVLAPRVLMGIMIPASAFWLLVFYFILVFPSGQNLWSSRLRIGLMGGICLLPTWLALVQLKYLHTSGYLVLALIALVSVMDIGAFFAGRAWGRRKLAPEVSPKKSWAGFWGGISCCMLLSVVLLGLFHSLLRPLDAGSIPFLLLIALLLAVLSVIGDLFESMLKRHQGLKDSGSSLPGHGGILDRIDSLMAAAPVFLLTLSALLADRLWP